MVAPGRARASSGRLALRVKLALDHLAVKRELVHQVVLV